MTKGDGPEMQITATIEHALGVKYRAPYGAYNQNCTCST